MQIFKIASDHSQASMPMQLLLGMIYIYISPACCFHCNATYTEQLARGSEGACSNIYPSSHNLVTMPIRIRCVLRVQFTLLSLIPRSTLIQIKSNQHWSWLGLHGTNKGFLFTKINCTPYTRIFCTKGTGRNKNIKFTLAVLNVPLHKQLGL